MAKTMVLGNVNAAGQAVVKCGKLTFRVMDTPRAVGVKALQSGCKVGAVLTVATNYGFGKESRKYVLTLDGGEGFAERR